MDGEKHVVARSCGQSFQKQSHINHLVFNKHGGEDCWGPADVRLWQRNGIIPPFMRVVRPPLGENV